MSNSVCQQKNKTAISKISPIFIWFLLITTFIGRNGKLKKNVWGEDKGQLSLHEYAVYLILLYFCYLLHYRVGRASHVYQYKTL